MQNGTVFNVANNQLAVQDVTSLDSGYNRIIANTGNSFLEPHHSPNHNLQDPQVSQVVAHGAQDQYQLIGTDTRSVSGLPKGHCDGKNTTTIQNTNLKDSQIIVVRGNASKDYA